eukprot:m.74626 g.74626  ORF g.74626 m.74626 type:complete len:504 (+) comp24682_c0_seq1:172-1683(+)
MVIRACWLTTSVVLGWTAILSTYTCNRFAVVGQVFRPTELNKHTIEPITTAVVMAEDTCANKLGTSLGNDFLTCVIENTQEAISASELKSKIKIPSYHLDPLNFDQTDAAYETGLLIQDLLRNYTCARTSDGGSDPIVTRPWLWNPKSQNCVADKKYLLHQLLEFVEAGDIVNAQHVKRQYDQAKAVSSTAEAEADHDETLWEAYKGYLPDGHDLDYVEMSPDIDVEDVQKRCESIPNCAGFTMTGTSAYLKSVATRASVSNDDDWDTHIRPKPKKQVCQQNAGATKYRAEEYVVEVIREEPYVAVIKNFSSNSECALLKDELAHVWDDMTRAYEGDGQTAYRQSYAENIFVDFDDQSAKITQLAERMFGAVRDLAGYNVHGNEGQEPLNIVLYKNKGDEYRPHCDGACYGGRYDNGARVATSILYCGTADEGGQTSFTRSGLMISPEPNDFLIFGYKLNDGTMDTGKSEHSGCPVTKGKKWIATQWYREGVDIDTPWDSFPE